MSQPTQDTPHHEKFQGGGPAAGERFVGMTVVTTVLAKRDCVCHLSMAYPDGSHWLGSGFLMKLPASHHLISTEPLFWTNHHCIADPETARNSTIRLFFDEQDSKTVTLRLNPEQFFRSYKDLDVCVVAVDWPAELTDARLATVYHHPMMASTHQPAVGDRITIIQHPSGRPKQFHNEGVVDVLENHLRYKVDTLGGSSGSPCLDSKGQVQAIHHRGYTHFNQGVLISVILERLLLVQQFLQYTQLAEGGDAQAQCNLAECYWNGVGVDEDHKQALEWDMKAANQGVAESQAQVADCLHRGDCVDQDLEQAVEWAVMAASQGDAFGMAILGWCLYRGEGVTQDYKQAAEWATKGAALGHPSAMSLLARCFHHGRGVDQDFKQAAEWARRGAAQDDASAMAALGWFFYRGDGVRKDHKQAVHWLTKSANDGNAEGQGLLANCYFRGHGVAQDHKQAVVLATKAAIQGNAFSQGLLGWCYKHGKGVIQNDNKAAEWFSEAAGQGVAFAQAGLGKCYENGKGVIQDDNKAVEWYTKAALQENAFAQHSLGLCYTQGKGVARDYTQAAELFSKARDRGNRAAGTSLVFRCYLNPEYWRSRRLRDIVVTESD